MNGVKVRLIHLRDFVCRSVEVDQKVTEKVEERASKREGGGREG